MPKKKPKASSIKIVVKAKMSQKDDINLLVDMVGDLHAHVFGINKTLDKYRARGIIIKEVKDAE